MGLRAFSENGCRERKRLRKLCLTMRMGYYTMFLSATVFQKRAKCAKPDFRVDWGYQYLYPRRHYHSQYVRDGASGEVFWTIWKDGEKTVVMLCSADWTACGNEKTAALRFANGRMTLEVRKGCAAAAETD